MALKRKLLQTMGLTEEQIDTIIEAHTDTVNGLKNKIDTLENDASDVADLRKKLESYEKRAGKDAGKGSGEGNGGDDWESRYTQAKQELEDYKAQVDAKEAADKVKAAYKKLLDEEHVDPKRHDAILRVTAFDEMKLDKDGKLENADTLREGIKRDWADFVVSTGGKGADVGNPPAGNGGSGKTKEEIMAIKDTGERQRAIAENHELFGF